MNKLTLIKGNQTIELIINKNKYLLGDNYVKKHELIQIIREFFSGIKSSEYAINNVGQVKILCNEKSVSLKESLFFEVSPYFNLTNDLKLTSKSLVARYLENVYNSSTFYDLINTINILLSSLSDELDNESLIHSEFNALQSKQLLKLVTPQFIIENEVRNEFDLSYEEIIILQLNMIKYILGNSDYNISILYLFLPSITDKIRKELEQMNNCYILIDTIQYDDFMNLDEIFIINSKFLDIADYEAIYDLINNNENSYISLSMEEIKMNLENYFKKIDCEYSKSIKLLLE